MHVELDAITQLANALLYITHACRELNVETPVTRRIYTDSEAAQSHCLNNSASKKSKHLELRLQTVQDYQRDDRIDVIHVPGEDNCADQGSKSLDPETNLKHMIVILGHRMMPGKGVEGVQELDDKDIHAVQVAYMQAELPGYKDVTIDEDHSLNLSMYCVFMADVDQGEFARARAEHHLHISRARKSGGATLSRRVSADTGEFPRDVSSEDGTIPDMQSSVIKLTQSDSELDSDTDATVDVERPRTLSHLRCLQECFLFDKYNSTSRTLYLLLSSSQSLWRM